MGIPEGIIDGLDDGIFVGDRDGFNDGVPVDGRISRHNISVKIMIMYLYIITTTTSEDYFEYLVN